MQLMSGIDFTGMSDFEIIREALRILRDHASGHMRGGLMRAYTFAQAALEALDRIEQPSLLDDVPAVSKTGLKIEIRH